MSSKLTTLGDVRGRLSRLNSKKKFGRAPGVPPAGNKLTALERAIDITNNFRAGAVGYNSKRKNDGRTAMKRFSRTGNIESSAKLSLLNTLRSDISALESHCPCHTNACPCNKNMTCSCVSVCTCNSKGSGHCGWNAGARCGCNVKSFVCRSHQCTLDGCSCNCNGNFS